jgi:hypothetical protein
LGEGSPPGSGGADNEWSEARNNIERFDGYLNDLRKYGFGLVTGLLAVTGYLSAISGTALDPPTKLSVSVAILVLVVALSFQDGQYCMLQRAAVERARVLERALNLDLTSSMSRASGFGLYRRMPLVIYWSIAVATGILGVGVLWGYWLFVTTWIAAVLVALFLIWELSGQPPGSIVDWTVSQKVASTGTPIRITFTNLDPQNPQWWIHVGCKVEALPSDSRDKDHHSSEPVVTMTERKIRPLYLRQTEWVWATDAEKTRPGLYRIVGYWQLTDSSNMPQSRVRQVERFNFPSWGKSAADVGFERERYRSLSESDTTPKTLSADSSAATSWRAYTTVVELVKSGESGHLPRSPDRAAHRHDPRAG